MSVAAVSLGSGADLVSALGQNAGQAQGIQATTSIAAVKDAIDSENQTIQGLLNATIAPGAPGSQLNVFG